MEQQQHYDDGQGNDPALLKALHADLVERLDHDRRLRAVEQQTATLGLLPAELLRMEDRIMRAIGETKVSVESNRPKPVWPAVSSVVAAVALLLVVAQALYTK